MTTITVQIPAKAKAKVLAFVKELGGEVISISTDRNAKKAEIAKASYNPDFVAKIHNSKIQIEERNFITINPGKSIWENLE